MNLTARANHAPDRESRESRRQPGVRSERTAPERLLGEQSSWLGNQTRTLAEQQNQSSVTKRVNHKQGATGRTHKKREPRESTREQEPGTRLRHSPPPSDNFLTPPCGFHPTTRA